MAHSPCLSRDSRHSCSVGLVIRLSSHDCSCPLAPRKSFDILALYKSDYYYYYYSKSKGETFFETRSIYDDAQTIVLEQAYKVELRVTVPAPRAVETRDLPNISPARRRHVVVVVVVEHRSNVSLLSLVVVSASSAFLSQPSNASPSTDDKRRLKHSYMHSVQQFLILFLQE